MVGVELVVDDIVNEAQLGCALCEAPSGNGNDSREHILPNAIGGRKTVRGFLCRVCNTMAGEGIVRENRREPESKLS